MGYFTASPLSLPAASKARPKTFGELLSKLPTELVLQIFENLLILRGPISKKDFWAGECEWPGCLCQGNHWEHIPSEELTETTLAPLLAATKPIRRLAQYVFYRSNNFRVCDARCDMDWATHEVWLPPLAGHPWIQRVEVMFQITSPGCNVLDGDLVFLQQMQRLLRELMSLKTLKLMVEAIFVTTDGMLRVLDRQWGMRDPFYFDTPELVLEACSEYPIWGHVSELYDEGDLVRDQGLERVLIKHVAAKGSVRVGGEECVSSTGSDIIGSEN